MKSWQRFWNWKRRFGLTPWVGHTNNQLRDFFLENQGLSPIGSGLPVTTVSLL
jgi:hypothetical protein